MPEYTPEYNDLALKVLSRPFKTKLHLCQKINCTIEALEEWIESYPAFRESIKLGLITGEVQFRNILTAVSLIPSSKVNTKLICLAGENIYGIKSEAEPQIVINNTNSNVVNEQTLKDKGIPVPKKEVEDVE